MNKFLHRSQGSIAIFFLASIVLFVTVQSPTITWFNTHMARDLMRSWQWLQSPGSQLWGPELNYSSGRLFGPAYYVYLGILWFMTGDLERLLILKSFVHVAVLILFIFILRKDFGSRISLVTALLLCLMPVHVVLERTLWNPSIVILINIMTVLTAREIALKQKGKQWWVLLWVMGVVGMQIHLTTLICFFSCCIVCVCIRKQVFCFLGVISAFFFWLSLALYWQQTGSLFIQGVTTQYALSIHWVWEGIQRWSYHFSPTCHPIGDYEQFLFGCEFGRALYPEIFKYISSYSRMSSVIAAGYCILFLITILSLRIKAIRIDRRMQFWLGVTTTQLLGSVVFFLFYTAKNGILPYRYGLAIYPMQFLIPGLFLYCLRLMKRDGFQFRTRMMLSETLFITLASMIFILNAIFITTLIKVNAISGRTVMFYEVPLRWKFDLIKRGFEASQIDGDPFASLHGPIVNRVRFKEHDWMQQVNYHVLTTLVEHPIRREPNQYVVRYISLQEMQARARADSLQSPLVLEKLEMRNIPAHVSLKYQSADGVTVKTDDIVQPSMIEPNQSMNVPYDTLNLTAHFTPGSDRFLRVSFDSLGWAKVFQPLRIDVDEMPLTFSVEPGGFNGQKVATTLLPEQCVIKDCFVTMQFKSEMQKSKYSRIDVFLTKDSAPFMESWYALKH